MFANSKKVTTFAPAIEREILDKKDGPFVYRLGRKIFILERGVRFPHGLPNKKAIDKSMAFLFLSCFVQGIQYSRKFGRITYSDRYLSILLPADILAYFDLNLPTLLF